MNKYDEQGRLLIPLSKKADDANETCERYILTEAYCPNGCNIMDEENKINGYPGLRIKFKRKDCEGEFVISAIEGDFSKIILSGKLKDKVKDELLCPKCGIPFEKLISCNCSDDADLVVVGLTPALDFNNSIAFCNVTGCRNGSFVHSGHILRHHRLKAL